MPIRWFPKPPPENFFRWFVNDIPKHKDLYPFFSIFACVGAAVVFISGWSLSKQEVMFNKFDKAPWHWERAKHDFDKKQKLWPGEGLYRRNALLDELMEEMETEEKARGLPSRKF